MDEEVRFREKKTLNKPEMNFSSRNRWNQKERRAWQESFQDVESRDEISQSIVSSSADSR